MDATVPQRDGFRFMYVLPLAEDRLLVEDTTFSDSPRLDQEALRESVHEYEPQGEPAAEIEKVFAAVAEFLGFGQPSVPGKRVAHAV